MISVSGIRGVIGETLTPVVAVRYAAAFGTWCSGGTIVVGADSRVSGPVMKGAVISALMATGCQVVDIGLAPTPTVEIAVKNLNAHGGIAITASHNPVQWNAMKMIGPGGLFLNEAQMNEVLEIAEKNTTDYTPWDRLGKHTYFDNAIRNHIDQILDLPLVSSDLIGKSQFRVAVDCVNGAAGIIVPALLRQLGCEVIVINEEAHGIFSHNPEPTAENLEALAHAVKEHHCHAGFAFDPDVDRLALVAENGKAIGEEYTLALATDLVLSHRPGPVVVNASTSAMVTDLAERYKVRWYRTKIGEINVSTKMKEVGAAIGGEGNGGVILPAIHFGRDAVSAAALILQLMAERKSGLSEIVKTMPNYVMKKGKIELQEVNVTAAFDVILRNKGSARVDRTDGIRLDFEDGWIHVRPSNTEPILRIIVEARNNVRLNDLWDRFTRFI